MWSLKTHRKILLLISALPFYFTLKLFPSGFLSNDDASIAISRLQHNSILESSYDIAQTTGRFYQIIFYSLSQIPYLTPEPLLQISIGFWRSIFVLFFFVATYQFSKHFFGQVTAYLTIFLTSVTIDLSGWYNSLVTYPFWISLGISLALLSAIHLDRYLLSHDKKQIFLFLVFSCVAILSYEAMLGSCFLYIFVFLRSVKLSESKLSSSLKTNKKLLVLFSCFLVMYFIVYFLFRILVDGRYAGTVLGSLNLRVIFTTLFKESLLHSSLKNFFIDESGVFGIKINTLQLERTLLNPLGVAICLTIFVIFFSLIALSRSTSRQNVVQEGPTFSDHFWLPFLIFVPNILLSLSKLRQSSLDHSPYTMSLFSLVFLNLFLASSARRLFLTRNKESILGMGRCIAAIVLVFILSTSAATQIQANISYVNERSTVAQVWKLLHRDDLRLMVENESETIYSQSIPRITRTEGWPVWHFLLGKQDPKFLTSGTKPPDYNHLEALKSNCGYLFVFIQEGRITKSFLPSGCSLNWISLTTSDFQFSSDLGAIFRREWSNIRFID
jgi:hypothetical protein